jgi:hypothetical protein
MAYTENAVSVSTTLLGTLSHALARLANANQGLTFTDSHGNDPYVVLTVDKDDNNDSTYDPDRDTDDSYASSEDSNYNPEDASSDASSTNLSAGPTPTKLAGVDEPGLASGVATRTPKVATRTPGVDTRNSGVADATPGVTDRICEWA